MVVGLYKVSTWDLRFGTFSQQSRKFQGGRWYFSRREITARVGGPGNMAVYRHILVMPPTAKVVTVINRKTVYRQTISAVLHYCRENTAILWFYLFHQEKQL